MQTEELNNKHRQENAELAEMGFTVHDKEWWVESERQKREWAALSRPAAVVVDEESGTISVVTSTERRCRDCDVILPAPSGRGRPHVKCAPCRGVATESELIYQ